ncbi:MAG: DNA mismatch repair protein MutS, partial [Selenomonas sp.]|nr:DNA mismatch repair protein MutS [Selenomonas sp.]
MNTTADKQHFFATRYEKAQDKAKDLARQSSRFTALRTLSFLLMVFSFAAGYDGHPGGTILGLMLLLSFLVLVHRHRHIKAKQRLQAGHIRVIKAFLGRFRDDWKSFADDGSPLLPKDQPQGTDLHIFGPASFYQYLCCAQTLRGKERLAAALSITPPSRTKILARQESVKELIQRPNFCLDLLARAAQLPDGHDTTSLLAEIESPLPHSRHSILRYRTAWILPTIIIISLLLAAAGNLSWTIPGFLAGLQFFLAMVFHSHNREVLAPLNRLTHELHFYEALFHEIEQAEFKSTTLCGLQQRLRTGRASQNLRRLAILTDFVALSRNFFFAFLANTLLLWDCHMAAHFRKWHENASISLREWIDIWSEFEVLISLSTVGHTRSQWTFPELKSGSPALCADSLSSLLIAEDKAIPNDAAFPAGTCIITGS